MTRTMRRAFTLVELMIVVAIIGILVALLMPGITNAWSVAQMTQCQTNLATLYKAQANWNADREATENSLNQGWGSSLKNYLESRTDALKCPSAIVVLLGNAGDSGGGGSGGGGGGNTGGGAGGITDSSGNDYLNPEETTSIELQDVTIGVTDDGGNTLYEIPLSPSNYWTMYQSWTLPDGRTHIGSNLDNDHRLANAGEKTKSGGMATYGDEDFTFTVEYRGTAPVRVTINDCDGSANKYWTDFRLNHKPIFDGRRWLKRFAADIPAGTVVDVQKEMAKVSKTSAGSQNRTAYANWTVMSTSKDVLGAASYGINRGSYQVADSDTVQYPNGRDVPRPDPKLIFILDYPKPIADMTSIGDFLGDLEFFNDIFISPPFPPDNWKEPPRMEGRTWEEAQALRHFGRANVLFCDGHIESMEKPELDVNNQRILKSLWNYQGK